MACTSCDAISGLICFGTAFGGFCGTKLRDGSCRRDSPIRSLSCDGARNRMSLRKTGLIHTPQPPPPANELCQYTPYSFAPDIRFRTPTKSSDPRSVRTALTPHHIAGIRSIGCARRGGGCLAEPGRLGRRGLDAANRSYDLTNEITASRTSVGVPSGRVKRDTHRRVWAMQSESRRQDPSRNFVPQNPPNAVPKQISALMASHDVHAVRIPSSRGKSERAQILFRPRFENARSNPRFR